MNFYRTKYFRIEELVHPNIYNARILRAWELLRPEALATLDALRDKFGPIVINDWLWAGRFVNSGLREMDSAIGAKFSMHKYGGAFDCKPKEVTAAKMYDYVLDHPSEFPLITAVEDKQYTPTWFHFDCRNSNKEGIWVVNP